MWTDLADGSGSTGIRRSYGNSAVAARNARQRNQQVVVQPAFVWQYQAPSPSCEQVVPSSQPSGVVPQVTGVKGTLTFVAEQ
jgi:hypothetical protein